MLHLKKMMQNMDFAAHEAFPSTHADIKWKFKKKVRVFVVHVFFVVYQNLQAVAQIDVRQV
jgi:hypothetical protein